MGLLDKVKGILFDEEEIEIPEIKKEPKKSFKKNIEPIKEEENPIKELKIPKDDFSDKEYKSESTFTFPIDFEDDEPIKIEEHEPPKQKEIREYKRPERKEQPIERDFTNYLNKKEEKKKFVPTPIISPVYGVLDQNYKKEDVIVKKEVLRIPGEPTLDEVRKKAFGSLEDEIDANLTNTKEIKISEEIKTTKEKKTTKKEKVEEPVDKLKTIGELIEEDAHSLEIPDISGIKDDDDEYNNDDKVIIDEVPTKSVKEVLNETNDIDSNDAEIDDEEADLFSLIDSMYEEKGE